MIRVCGKCGVIYINKPKCICKFGTYKWQAVYKNYFDLFRGWLRQLFK